MSMFWVLQLLIVAILYTHCESFGIIGKDEKPKNYAECIEYDFLIAETRNISRVEVQTYCKDLLVSKMEQMSAQMKTTNVSNYVNHLLRGIISDAESGKHRHKRSIFGAGTTYRREIREQPYDQVWGCYARGVRRLKNSYDVSRTMNTYDVIASLHTGRAIPFGHDGPGFFGWHKAFLRIMEFAIGCPIPYWDTTLDHPMADPTQSCVWGPRYFGNGYGMVTTGPFASLNGEIPVMRNINARGWLMSRQDIGMALSKRSFHEFTEPSPCYYGARRDYSMECFHDGVHVWIDGTSETSATASYDPLFFPMHAFVDKIFSMFRQRMVERGTAQYPDKGINGHGPNDRMVFYNTYPGIESITQSDAYSDRMAQLTRYSMVPSCPSCANSPDLYCDRRRNICVSRSLQESERIAINRIPVRWNGETVLRQIREPDSPMRTRSLMNRMGSFPFNGRRFRVGTRDRRTRNEGMSAMA